MTRIGTARFAALLAALAAIGCSSCSSIVRVSVDVNGKNPNNNSRGASISADGRYVAFVSSANDVVADDGNATSDVFVRDLQNRTTIRASVDVAGGDADSGSD